LDKHFVFNDQDHGHRAETGSALRIK